MAIFMEENTTSTRLNHILKEDVGFLDINSSPGLGIVKSTTIDVAAAMIKYIEKMAEGGYRKESI